jgi:hypothetical protein
VICARGGEVSGCGGGRGTAWGEKSGSGTSVALSSCSGRSNGGGGGEIDLGFRLTRKKSGRERRRVYMGKIHAGEVNNRTKSR